MNRAIENFRDHPTLQYDSPAFVFKIEGKVYSIIDGIVRQIIIKSIRHTNIGDPYAKLIRLDFVFADDADDEYGEYIDFSFNRQNELKELMS